MSSTDEVVQEARLVGQVKWFNNKAGYGFITVSDGDHAGKDIFVHFTTVRVTNSQYKYLIQGEYVEFSLTKSTSGTHEYQATDVSGIKGGALMCETRRNNRVSEGEEPAKPQRRYRVPTDDSRPPRTPRAPRPTRADGEADGQGEFTEVRRRPTSKPQAKSAPRAKKEVA